jgi:sugar phosphate isomerase/epimerase
MKLAVRESMVPGATLEEKLSCLKRCGYDGIELTNAETMKRHDLVPVVHQSGLGVSTLAGITTLLDPDPKVRAGAVDLLKSWLEVTAALNGVGVIVVPIFGRPVLPDLSPYKTPVELETELLLAELKAIAPFVEKVGSTVIIEPLNRYETHFVNRLEQGVTLCEAVGSPVVRIMADFFHMHIEEADIPTSIRAAGQQIVYVHVADSNRVQPGRGHLDLRPGFAALKAVGYDGYFGIECGLVGDPEEALKQAAANTRQAWAEA